MFAAINICLAIFVWFLIPETRKVRLEEIDTLFGGSNHVEKGAEVMGVEDAHHAHGENDEKIGSARVEEVRA